MHSSVGVLNNMTCIYKKHFALGSTRAYTVFLHCRGMGRERFEVVDDARRASERHQLLEGVLRKVAGRASAH